jgi:endonuclease YncB( thermonuclease family)
VASASDSDTLRIRGVPFAIRLHGIDGPEAAQTCNAKDEGKWLCGVVAAQELRKLVDEKQVECVRAGEGQDLYDRMLAICYVDGLNINEHMVERGLAWSFRRYSDDYNAIEDGAKARLNFATRGANGAGTISTGREIRLPAPTARSTTVRLPAPESACPLSNACRSQLNGKRQVL